MNITCISNYGYFDSPEFLLLSMHTVTIFSTPIHLIGLYCILFKTPEEMKSVKWYMLILHVWIMIFDYSLSVLTVPFFLFPRAAGIPLGILNKLGVPILLQTVFVLNVMGYMCYSIVSIFENRFFVVSHFGKNDYWTFWRRPWLAMHYIGVFLAILRIAQLIPEQSEALDWVFANLPCLPEYIYRSPVFVVITTNSLFLRSTILVFLFTFVFEILFFAGFMSRNLLKQLKSNRMSQKTYQMQRSSFFALVIQMMLPLGLFVVPLIGSLTLSFLQTYNQAAINCIFTVVSAHGVFSTTVMLIVHRPYRETVSSWVRMEKRDRRTHVKGFNSSVAIVPL